MKAILLFLAATLCAAPSSAQTLGVWADSLETDCNIIAPYPGDPVTAYIIGTMTNEEGQCAIGGAFRIDGLPAGWTTDIVSVTPEPILLLGDPFGDPGVHLGFPGCVPDLHFVMTVSITPTSAVSNVTLLPVPHAEAIEGACGFEGAGCSPVCNVLLYRQWFRSRLQLLRAVRDVDQRRRLFCRGAGRTLERRERPLS